MGKATRWLKSLFGFKPSNSGDTKRRGSVISCRETSGCICDSHQTIPPNISEREAAWLRSFYAAGEAEKQRRTHAIAVAAATAAAADAAVAAANAAAAVVRLTGQRKSGPFGDSKVAALKIQCAFRGYLARKALRALKGVVKIQALVRGYLVRRQAAATLRSMEAMLRAQAAIKFHRALLRSTNAAPPRKSMERFSGWLENRSNSEETAKIVEVDTGTRPGSARSRENFSFGSDLFDDPFRRTFSSPLSGRVPPRLSTTRPDWDECSSKFPTAQSTPRFAGGSPSKSGGGGGETNHRCFFTGYFHPNYMADTTSFRAKLRSQSAPRQRPETTAVGGWRRSVSGGVRVRRPSCSGVREAGLLREAVVGKLDKVEN